MATATTSARPPFPPFTRDSAMQKVRLAEDAWNTRDPARVALAYAIDPRWRNRSEFINGRDEAIAFLARKWAKSLGVHMFRYVATILVAIVLSAPLVAGITPFPASFHTQIVPTNGTSLYVRVGVPFVSEAYSDPVPGKRPQLLDEPVVQLLGPLTREESDNFVSSVDEFRSIPPS